jgi:hypothetical protein
VPGQTVTVRAAGGVVRVEVTDFPVGQEGWL